MCHSLTQSSCQMVTFVSSPLSSKEKSIFTVHHRPGRFQKYPSHGTLSPWHTVPYRLVTMGSRLKVRGIYGVSIRVTPNRPGRGRWTEWVERVFWRGSGESRIGVEPISADFAGKPRRFFDFFGIRGPEGLRRVTDQEGISSPGGNLLQTGGEGLISFWPGDHFLAKPPTNRWLKSKPPILCGPEGPAACGRGLKDA